MINKIYRSADIASNEGRFIEGYAVVFNVLSADLGGFREIIRPGAINQDLINSSDIIANMNHRDDYMMARLRNGKGNIDLTIDQHGLKFKFECPETAKGEELLQHVKRGEITQCSFAFSLDYLDKGSEKWTVNSDGTQVREILKIEKLYDISCVINPAYEATECQARDIEHCKRQTRINKVYEFYSDLLDELDK